MMTWVLAGLVAASVASDPQTRADEVALKALLDDYTKAYNAAKFDALGALLAEDAELIDPEGETIAGREAIVAVFAKALDGGEPAPLSHEIRSIRLLTPDVANVAGDFRLGPEKDPLDSGRFTVTVVRKGESWKIATLRDYPRPDDLPVPHAEYLRPLEWLVGEWVDEGSAARISSTVRWALDRHFLIRDYTVEPAETGDKALHGTMIIGWDPQAGRIRSWMFDSDGGHGEARWTRLDDDRWLLKAEGVQRDGTPTSATQILIREGKDSVHLTSIDRVIGDELADDLPEVVMVRKPAEPSKQ